MRDHYDVLGISSNATQEEIKQAYREKVRLWHPDRNKSEEAHERIIEINKAYEVLEDPEKRRVYDLSISRKSYNYQTNKRGQKKHSIWGDWRKIAFLIIILIQIGKSLFFDSNSENSIPVEYTLEPTTSSFYDFSVDSLSKKLILDSNRLIESKKNIPPFIAYQLQNDSSLKYDNHLTSRLNGNNFIIGKSDIKTIIVYELIYYDEIQNNGNLFWAKIYFIDPSSNKVYKIKTTKNDLPSYISLNLNITHTILTN